MADIRYELVDSTAVITLSHPGRLNACTPAMTEPFLACVGAADRDDHVRAVVVTGTGGAFCGYRSHQAGRRVRLPRRQRRYGRRGRAFP